MTDEFRWPAVTKDPEETLPVALSLFGLCAQFWEANEQYSVGDFVWPIVETADGEVSGVGFCLECTRAGRSGFVQPAAFTSATKLAASLDQPLPLDGSVEWTPRLPGTGGISAVSQPNVEPPPGITVTGLVVNENTKLFVDYATGTNGEDYDVKFTFVIGGRLRVGRQTVQVRLE